MTDMEWTESRHRRSEEREQLDGAHDDLEGNGTRDSSNHRSKDSKKSSRREEKDHKSKDRERLKVIDKDAKDSERDRVSSRERRKEDRDERDKDRSRDKGRDKDHDRDNKYKDKERELERERDKDRKDRGKEKDRDREREINKDTDRGWEKEKGKDKNREKEKERDRVKDKGREKERERQKDWDDKDTHKDRAREKGKEKTGEKERKADQDKERSRESERMNGKRHEEDHDRNKDSRKDDKPNLDYEDNRDRDAMKAAKVSHFDVNEQNNEGMIQGANPSTRDLEDRILRMREERLNKKSEGISEVLSWVSKSRKLEEKKNSEKEKALQLSKLFEEQDNIVQGDSEDEEASQHTAHDLSGVKVLHGLDKVIEGGAVVLTLKDQSILADGDINDEVDKLENVEIGEQKQRDEAYKASKKRTGIYDDKFNDEPGTQKKMLPQYDDPVVDEGLTLGTGGRFTAEAEKKLEELRRRIQGVSTDNRVEDLNSSGKVSSDYYTQEEMLKFKKPKKRKSLRKKEKLDLDALEAEAVSAGFGVKDLGSRNDGKRQAIKEEHKRAEAEMKKNAYQLAYTKADKASKSLRMEQTLPRKLEEDESVFADDDVDLYKSLERARKLALKKQDNKAVSGPQAIALLASSAGNQNTDDQNLAIGESQENKVVFTEMEEFVWGLQIDEETHKPDSEDVFMDEDEVQRDPEQDSKDEAGGWTEVKETNDDEHLGNDDTEVIVPDEIIHEIAVGKGLSGALKLLKDRGTLKESIDWGGRNMDKKKSKLVGIADNDGPKEIHIERTDEFGRIMTPKEAFRMISHKFHGKGPGKMKQEKRMKQFQEEQKLKQMKNSDTPSLSVERMREAQARLKTPYLVLSGQVKPGQTSDPRSGFATVEKDLPGGLTPMLGDRKVEHFLGIKRKGEPSNLGIPKKPKT